MHIAKRIMALCLSLLVLMMTTAQAEVPFLVHSMDWNWDNTPVDVMLKADVDTHMPFDEDRLAMLTPITDMLSLHLVTGQDAGLVTIGMDGEELLTLQYQGNAAQLSCMPENTYIASDDPMSQLLGADTSFGGGYETLHLAPAGELLLTDGRALLELLPDTFESYGKRSSNTLNISGYGKAAYRIDYTVAATKLVVMQENLLSICPDGWLREIIGGLSFSGKQTLRIYYTEDDVLLRMEYNGICGPEGDLRTVKLVYKMRHDDVIDKDYIELTSPARKGRNKNNLTFERTVETNKKGERVIKGDYTYSVIEDEVSSIWKGTFDLKNAYTAEADVLSGSATFESKLNGAEKYDAIAFEPQLMISGSEESPAVTGTLTVTEKYAGKITENAVISIELKRADALNWQERPVIVDLSAMEASALAAAQQEIAARIATTLVRPMILKLGTDAQWFFRELPAEAIQSIIDAASGAQ